jgi:hypothetical protein
VVPHTIGHIVVHAAPPAPPRPAARTRPPFRPRVPLVDFLGQHEDGSP